mmetsp:Transcript_28918/g.92543  ORF Transcript_28918/g.92543 Transcript_28918/m.92543 type:complete len:246 (+) Transcript_28918:904-1641(+)
MVVLLRGRGARAVGHRRDPVLWHRDGHVRAAKPVFACAHPHHRALRDTRRHRRGFRLQLPRHGLLHLPDPLGRAAVARRGDRVAARPGDDARVLRGAAARLPAAASHKRAADAQRAPHCARARRGGRVRRSTPGDLVPRGGAAFPPLHRARVRRLVLRLARRRCLRHRRGRIRRPRFQPVRRRGRAAAVRPGGRDLARPRHPAGNAADRRLHYRLLWRRNQGRVARVRCARQAGSGGGGGSVEHV